MARSFLKKLHSVPKIKNLKKRLKKKETEVARIKREYLKAIRDPKIRKKLLKHRWNI